jgi:hypothetical protein
MKLIARIDGNGQAFVGMYGRDDKWVKSDNIKPVTVVRNEDYGEDVTYEDVVYAQFKHKIQNDATFFADNDVMDFCLSE